MVTLIFKDNLKVSHFEAGDIGKFLAFRSGKNQCDHRSLIWILGQHLDRFWRMFTLSDTKVNQGTLSMVLKKSHYILLFA